MSLVDNLTTLGWYEKEYMSNAGGVLQSVYIDVYLIHDPLLLTQKLNAFAELLGSSGEVRLLWNYYGNVVSIECAKDVRRHLALLAGGVTNKEKLIEMINKETDLEKLTRVQEVLE